MPHCSRVYWPSCEIKQRILPDGGPAGIATGAYTYDAAGRLSAIGNLEAVPDRLIDAIAYNGRGQPSRIDYGNGVATTMGYSPGRSLLQSIAVREDSQERLSLAYARDAAGRITRALSDGSSEDWAYAYDGLGHLVEADNLNDNALDQSWTYDLAGNMISNSKLGAIAYGNATGPRTSYSAYGDPLTSVQSSKAYINERYDPDTGLQYLHARDYDPALGRFLTPDTWDPHPRRRRHQSICLCRE